MGRWSDPREVFVCQDTKGTRSKDDKDKSGEASCPLDGRLVGVSSFNTAMSEFEISKDNKLPLEYWMLENQRGSWAFMSPMTNVSASLKRSLSGGL